MDNNLPGDTFAQIVEDGLFMPVVTSTLSAGSLRVEFLSLRQPSQATSREELFTVAFTSASRLVEAMPGWERWANPHVDELIEAVSPDAWFVIDPSFESCLEVKFAVLRATAEAGGLVTPVGEGRPG